MNRKDERTTDLVREGWIDGDEWAQAPPSVRRQFLRELRPRYLDAKRGQIEAGIGADGRRLRRLLNPRPDGSVDRPLIPRDAMSRALAKLTAWIDPYGRLPRLVVHWGEFTEIVEAHAAGIRSRIGPIVRDILDMPGRLERPVRDWARARWRQLWPFSAPIGGGFATPAAAVARPRRGRQEPRIFL